METIVTQSVKGQSTFNLMYTDSDEMTRTCKALSPRFQSAWVAVIRLLGWKEGTEAHNL